MGGEQAQMVFSDPPYNVPVDGHVCGLGSVKHAAFAMASGEMTETEFTGFLSPARARDVLARLRRRPLRMLPGKRKTAEPTVERSLLGYAPRRRSAP